MNKREFRRTFRRRNGGWKDLWTEGKKVRMKAGSEKGSEEVKLRTRKFPMKDVVRF